MTTGPPDHPTPVPSAASEREDPDDKTGARAEEQCPTTDLNLVDEEPNATAAPPKPSGELVGRTKPLEDWARVGLAGILVVVLAILVLGMGLAVLISPEREPVIESFLKLVFTPMVGLVGSVIGFYFGSRRPDG